MAAPLLLKGFPLLRPRLQRYNRLATGLLSAPRRPWCAATESTGHEEEVSSTEKSSAVLSVRDPPKYHRWDDPDYRKWKSKEKEILRDIEPIISLTKEILHSDRPGEGRTLWIHPSLPTGGRHKETTTLTFHFFPRFPMVGFEPKTLRSTLKSKFNLATGPGLRWYMDGERLTVADEEAVVEKLLSHHPHSEDKIGCGLDSIMVDRHPQFRHSRCLFVVRTDGGWIDFSYQKCLRAYIRDKYPSRAERFIREHFKRGSG